MNSLEQYLCKHEARFLEELQAWLRIPSISTHPEHQADMDRAAQFAVAQLHMCGFDQVQLLPTTGHPLVYAEWLKAVHKPTLLIYGHYDVQPAEPLDQWISPPFEPTIRGDQLYARGASDDKGQVMVVLKALEALMQISGEFPVNLRVLLEGEEESGGGAIEEYVRASPERLACDAVFICDTGMATPETPALIYGLRGILYVEMELQGAKQDLHSGLYSGIAPNPFHALASIILGLQDQQGHLCIPGLFDHASQPSLWEEQFWMQDPYHMEELLLQEIGRSQFTGEAAYPPLQRLVARPTLEVHGIRGGFIEKGAKTVIPATVMAKMSLRLPPELNLTSSDVYALLERYVKDLTPVGISVEVRKHHGGEALLLPLDAAPLQLALVALKEVFGQDPALLRMGGTLPVAVLFHEVLAVPIVMMGFSLPDDHLHAPNEKYGLSQFEKGMRVVASFLQKLGAWETTHQEEHDAQA